MANTPEGKVKDACKKFLKERGAFPFIGLVQNLQLWPGPLTSSDFIKMCSTGSFSPLALPTTCPTQPPLQKKMMP